MTKLAKDRAICKEIEELSAEVKAKTKRLEELKAYMRVESGEVNMDLGTHEVLFSDRTVPSVDAKRIVTERPDVFEEYGKYTTTKVMRIRAKK